MKSIFDEDDRVLPTSILSQLSLQPPKPPQPTKPITTQTQTQKNWQIEPEYAAAYTHWQSQRSPQATAAMLRTVTPVVEAAVRHYGRGQASPSLKAQAKVLAAQSFATYDPQRGPLKQHLYSNLQRLNRISAAEDHIISVPERVLMERQALQATEHNLRDTLGRDPSDGELADASGLALKRIAYVRQFAQPLNSGAFASGEDVASSQVGGNAATDDAWVDMVYHDLAPVDQYILEHTTGRGGKKVWPAAEIAKRLNITPSAVSQRASRIQAMIDSKNNPWA